MKHKLSLAAVCAFFPAFAMAHPHEAAVSIAQYQWKKDDSSVELNIPYSTNQDLNQQIHSRVDVILKRAFGKSFYVPSSSEDKTFDNKMNTFYMEQKKASSHIPVKAPVFTYSQDTIVLSKKAIYKVASDTHPKAATADIISLQINTQAMSKGAAHPSKSSGFINYDPHTMSFYDDLSFLKDEAQSRILADVEKTLEEKIKGDLLSKGKDLQKQLPHHFGFKEQKLYFTFSPGEVAPAVYGPQSVSVPLSSVDWK